MYRIGILGAENSHAMGFSQIFNGLRPDCADEFSDIQVVAVGGNYPDANRDVAEKCNVPRIVERPEELLGEIDAIMVTARDGRWHAPFVRPFIEAGIPAFIDKPFTSDPAEALELARLAKAKNVPIVGGSSLKLCADVVSLAEKAQSVTVLGGDVTAPVSLVNDYGDFWFYAAHLVEISLRIFGFNPEWVWANRTGRGVTAVVHYADFDVTHHFTEGAYHYAGSVCTKDGVIFQPFNIDDFTLIEARSFAKMLRTGEMDFSYEQLVQPVFVLAALEKSFLSGERISVESFEI